MTMAQSMPRSRAIGPILILVALTSCKVGGWNNIERSNAYGAEVSFTTVSGATFEGELLLADEGGLLIAAGSEVIHAAWPALAEMRVRRHPVDRFRAGDELSDSQLRSIQLASRYPYGLSEDQLRQVLAGYGVEAAREVR